jgi:hypothetical protein
MLTVVLSAQPPPGLELNTTWLVGLHDLLPEEIRCDG